MLQDLPTLAFVPVGSLLIHEQHDEQRTLPLIKRIRSAKVFRNPPVVTPLNDGSGRYMVLDGANRTTALQKLEFPHALVQIVEADDPGLNLQTWNHVVWELSAKRFLEKIKAIPKSKLKAEKGEPGDAVLYGEPRLALIFTAKGTVYALSSAREDIVERLQLLNALVESYQYRARLDRTMDRDIQAMANIYPKLCGLVIFPHFEIRDVLRLAGEGHLLPTGITRFTISPRALHLNYPLKELASGKTIEEKNADLTRWIKRRLEEKGVRYYAEATFLFDE